MNNKYLFQSDTASSCHRESPDTTEVGDLVVVGREAEEVVVVVVVGSRHQIQRSEQHTKCPSTSKFCFQVNNHSYTRNVTAGLLKLQEQGAIHSTHYDNLTTLQVVLCLLA